MTLGAFLVIWLGGQAWAGHRAYNDDQRDHGEPTVGFVEYLSQADVGGATFENWESEFLQMGVYVLLTAWLAQKDSAESKPAGGELEAYPRGHRPQSRRAVAGTTRWMGAAGVRELSEHRHARPVCAGVHWRSRDRGLTGSPSSSPLVP